MATLDPHQATDHPILVRLLQLLAAGHQPDPLRVPRHEPAHHVDLLQGELHRVQKLRLAWHVDGPELPAHDTLPQPHQVRLPLRAPAGVSRQVLVEREVLQLSAPSMLAQVPSEIVVPATGSTWSMMPLRWRRMDKMFLMYGDVRLPIDKRNLGEHSSHYPKPSLQQVRASQL